MAGARIPLNVRKWLTSGKYLNKLVAFGPGLNPELKIGFSARGAPLKRFGLVSGNGRHGLRKRSSGLLDSQCCELRRNHMPSGTIARLLIDKGFGFIRDEGGVEHFFHRSSVRGAVFELLREGQRVDFNIEESQKGPRAGEVRLIEG